MSALIYIAMGKKNSEQQVGAAGARWAHNSKVDRSKLSSAIFIF